MDFISLFSKFVTFIALMLVGYVGARRKVFAPAFAKSLSWLVINVFLSLTILNSVTSNSPELSGGQILNVLAMTSIAMLIGYVLAFIIVRIFKIRTDNTPVFQLLVSVPNTMFVGMPIVQSVYGSTAVLYCALSCIPFNVLLYTWGVLILRRGKSAAGGAGIRLKDMLTTPLIFTLAALAVFALKLPLPTLVADLVSTGAAATVPTSMIVIGATLGGVKLSDAFRERRAYIISFFRLIAAPLLTWLILRMFTTDAVLLATCIIISACPCGVIVSAMSLQYDYDAEFSSKGVLVTTVLSMVTLPVLVMLLAGV